MIPLRTNNSSLPPKVEMSWRSSSFLGATSEESLLLRSATRGFGKTLKTLSANLPESLHPFGPVRMEIVFLDLGNAYRH
jgi:hypothetical protein